MLLERKLSIPRQSSLLLPLSTKGVNTVPYRTGQYVPYRPVYTIPAGIYHTGKQIGTVNHPISYRKKYQPYRPCIDRTGQFRAILAGTGRTDRYRKKVFIFYFYYYYFLSFVIFEFLLGQNGNLFSLTY